MTASRIEIRSATLSGPAMREAAESLDDQIGGQGVIVEVGRAVVAILRSEMPPQDAETVARSVLQGLDCQIAVTPAPPAPADSRVLEGIRLAVAYLRDRAEQDATADQELRACRGDWAETAADLVEAALLSDGRPRPQESPAVTRDADGRIPVLALAERLRRDRTGS